MISVANTCVAFCENAHAGRLLVIKLPQRRAKEWTKSDLSQKFRKSRNIPCYRNRMAYFRLALYCFVKIFMSATNT